MKQSHLILLADQRFQEPCGSSRVNGKGRRRKNRCNRGRDMPLVCDLLTHKSCYLLVTCKFADAWAAARSGQALHWARNGKDAAFRPFPAGGHQLVNRRRLAGRPPGRGEPRRRQHIAAGDGRDKAGTSYGFSASSFVLISRNFVAPSEYSVMMCAWYWVDSAFVGAAAVLVELAFVRLTELQPVNTAHNTIRQLIFISYSLRPKIT